MFCLLLPLYQHLFWVATRNPSFTLWPMKSDSRGGGAYDESNSNPRSLIQSSAFASSLELLPQLLLFHAHQSSAERTHAGVNHRDEHDRDARTVLLRGILVAKRRVSGPRDGFDEACRRDEQHAERDRRVKSGTTVGRGARQRACFRAQGTSASAGASGNERRGIRLSTPFRVVCRGRYF